MSKQQQQAITSERHALALEMRKHGYSYDQIGEHFECSPTAARSLVKTAMEKAIREPGQEIIDLELQRLDQLYRVAFNRAATGEVSAINQCLAVMQRRAKYLGLDAPDKSEVTGAGGAPLAIASMSMKGMSDADLAAMKELLMKGAGLTAPITIPAPVEYSNTVE